MSKVEKLREKLTEKLDKEYNEFVETMRENGVDFAIENAYKMISMLSIKDYLESEERHFDTEEIKALIQSEHTLSSIYDAWTYDNGKFYDAMEYTIDEEIDSIIDDYDEQKEQKKNKKVDRESR